MSRLPRAVLLCVVTAAAGPLFSAASVQAAPTESPSSGTEDLFTRPIEGASRLEGRLLAPCCWDSSRQTLDIHGSPVANELRREIRMRLVRGESPESIEADLVERYTTKILAVPPGNPLRQIGIVLAVVMVFAGVGAVSLLLRWRRRAGEPSESGAQKPKPSAERDEWDDKLEAELDEAD